MSRLITKAEVKKHNKEHNIWIIIHNEVYDVTEYLDEHPGGADVVMEFAGKDGTQGFEDVGHSDDAREVMKKYKIGKLQPGEETEVDIPSAQGSGTRNNDCIVYQAASCAGSPKDTKQKKSWRTFDGTPDRPKTPKSDYKAPSTPRAEPRVQTVVVPRERRPRGPPCERRPQSPSPPSSNLKWYVLALGAAIVIGVVIKKNMA